MPPPPPTIYEPCRRMFLGHLPPSCTRNDIMTLIKSRARSTPAHIDIALAKRVKQPRPPQDAAADGEAGAKRKKDNDDDDDDNEDDATVSKQQQKAKDSDSDDDDNNNDDDKQKKKPGGKKPQPKGEKKPLRPCAGYAHLTIEGLKAAIDALQGAQINGQTIVAKQAKPHYLWQLEKVKRDREKEQEKKAEEMEKIREQPGFGELDRKTKPTIRSMDAAKYKFGNIASEIAARLRKKAKERKERMKQFSGGAAAAAAASAADGGARYGRFAGQRRGREDEVPGAQGATTTASAAASATGARPHNAAAAAGAHNSNFKGKQGGRPAPRPKGKGGAPAAAAAPPPPPPEPTKQDRKLSALEARLAALQAKLKK